MGRAILNYTTTVPADKTAMECIGVLSEHGASRVGMTFGEGGQPDGIEFDIGTRFGPRHYDLPVNLPGTQRVMDRAYRERRCERRHTSPEHVRRIAWRILKDWLEAQVALIEAGAVGLEQVMLPWMTVSEGKSLYAAWEESEQRALEAAAT